MIRGVHAMLYSTDAAATRAFLRDVVGLPANDVGDGWLIFDGGESEVGCHPLMGSDDKPHHDISLYTEDVEAAVRTLTARGVEFLGPIEDRGWGLATEMRVPGNLVMTLYQRRYGHA